MEYFSKMEKIIYQKRKIDRAYKLKLMENYDQIFQMILEDEYSELLNNQSKLNIRLIELEPLIKLHCDQIKRYSEYQTGYFSDQEYEMEIGESNRLFFCNFKFVIGIDDFRIRVEMSAVIESESEDCITLINDGDFDGNIKIYFNDIKIDTRELQGNSGLSENIIYNHFSHIFNDKKYFYEVYNFIILTYMKIILK